VGSLGCSCLLLLFNYGLLDEFILRFIEFFIIIVEYEVRWRRKMCQGQTRLSIVKWIVSQLRITWSNTHRFLHRDDVNEDCMVSFLISLA
jgi:hypothetical protein